MIRVQLKKKKKKKKKFFLNDDENKSFRVQGHTFSPISKLSAERKKMDKCQYFTDLFVIFIVIHYLNHTK